MPSTLTAVLLIAAAYLVGSIPFGYLIGRARGVDLFRVGSGNIGATNAGRVLGRKTGALVFGLDFLKGALPVTSIEPLAQILGQGLPDFPSALTVGAAVATFLGHLFPVTLGFRGGKGVATGAGTVAVLVPGPFLAALAAWALVILIARTISLASLVAVGILVAVRLLGTSAPFDRQNVAVTAYCCIGTLFVVVKHRANLRRISAGTESRIGDFAMRQTILRIFHVLAVGFWFGGAGFFNFVAAPSIFRSFEEVVATAPSDRTAQLAIVPSNTTDKQKENLGKALAGAAVGPIFPMYFVMQAICGIVAVGTAWSWRMAENGRRVHRTRLVVSLFALLTALAGWPLSNAVSHLRVMRFDVDPNKAAAAIEAFGIWHLCSLGLSVITVILAGVVLALAAKLPREES
ncbi:MAG TPA: glycerol-3-phosphate 1-O-acyltransferase PlsY [Fimbriiglobus sp.]|jgi:acyl-phosphate glycerol 3-phosphate acyltransferase